MVDKAKREIGFVNIHLEVSDVCVPILEAQLPFFVTVCLQHATSLLDGSLCASMFSMNISQIAVTLVAYHS